MSSIQSPRGLKAPTLQANSKQDGGGNGSGGMYFYQEAAQEEQDSFLYQDDTQEDLDGLPYSFPLLKSISEALKSWNAALAKLLYQHKD